jgi:hypothetical protein
VTDVDPAYLAERGMTPGDDASARHLWNERFLPMSIKSLGPSLLAAEVRLPIDQVAAYYSVKKLKAYSQIRKAQIFTSHDYDFWKREMKKSFMEI